MSIFKLLTASVTGKERGSLILEGKRIKQEIEALGIPKMWGTVPEEILNDALAFQKKCAASGFQTPAVFQRFESDREHTSATDVLLTVDEILVGLDPMGMVGG
jgi:hypothetical protein